MKNKYKLPEKLEKVISISFQLIGMIVVLIFIGYTLKECIKEIYEPRTIVIKIRNNNNSSNKNIENDRIMGEQRVESNNEGRESIEERIREIFEEEGDKAVAEFSAYTSDPAETDSTPYITADGTDLREHQGCVIASNDHPFGTKIEIEGFGVCEVHDRMNPRYTGTGNIDLYFGDDKQGALAFGRRNLEYSIVEL